MRSVLIALALFASTAAGQDACLKEVFNRYCLGGPIAAVTEKHQPRHTFNHRGSDVFVFTDDGEDTMVATNQGLIETVSRTYKPGTMLTFTRIKGQLVELYGQPKRDVTLPSYARDASSIETAIAVGRGRVRDSWQQDGWSIVLGWYTDKHISLIYYHDALRKQRRAADPNPSGF